jgi:AbrB family looped-hinge helix DNA binding protein
MWARLRIDKVGRIVIPKPLREELHLEPGVDLELESTGEEITLQPVRGTGPLPSISNPVSLTPIDDFGRSWTLA